MFENLKEYRAILVTGAQRSGTTVASKMIAQDTGHRRIDEVEFNTYDKEQWKNFALTGENVVIQCPSMCRFLEEVARDDVLIVMMKRDIEDIKANEKHVGWSENQREVNNYDGVGHQAEVKYKFWEDNQKDKIKNHMELEYESLREHPLWVDKEKRQHFGLKQTA